MDGKYAIEFILTLIFLVCGVVFKDTVYFVTSGLFAIATQIGLFRSER